MIRAFIAVTLANLVLMLPVGLLYVLSSYLLEGELPRDKFWLFMGAIVGVLLLIALTTLFQYKSTFYSTYVESGVRRRTLAEKLRKIPLSYFGKKDLADLTNTIMTDCAMIETGSSHWIPELVGGIVSTTISLGNAGSIYDSYFFKEGYVKDTRKDDEISYRLH